MSQPRKAWQKKRCNGYLQITGTDNQAMGQLCAYNNQTQLSHLHPKLETETLRGVLVGGKAQEIILPAASTTN